MNKTGELLLKMEKDAKLRESILKNQKHYDQIMNSYLETPNIRQGILKKVDDREIYFYFGFQQPLLKKNLRQVLIYLVKNFKPNVTIGYKLVFINDKCVDNHTLWNFRQTLSCLKLQQITAMIEFIIVNPYFYHKTMDWMTFGVINKFIKQNTKFIFGFQNLLEHLNITQNQFAAIVPPILYKNELPELYGRTASISSLRINITGQERSQQEKHKLSEFQKSIRSMLIKPGNQTIELEDYEIGAEGIPNILKMLIFYFDSHQEALLQQGIFRKSANIDQQNQTINEILSKNYDYILDVKNPYVIANLIKRFFSSLKTPLFPYSQFEKLMEDKNINDKVKHLKSIYDSLPQINRLTLTFVISFFIDKVVPNESTNKMPVHNIAVCFSPCIFRSQVPSAADFIYVGKSVSYTELLLTNFTDIFGSRLEIQANFRHSYEKQKKQFQQEIDIGIVEAVKQAEKQMQNLHLSKNCRTSSKYEENVEDGIDLLEKEEQEEAMRKDQKQDIGIQTQKMAKIKDPNQPKRQSINKDENENKTISQN